MQYNMWNAFQETGNVEVYLLYLEYKRLMDGEYADEITGETKENERKDARPDHSGD